MANHIRIGSIQNRSDYFGGRPCFAAGLGAWRMTVLAITLVTLIPLAAGPAQAGETFVDFEKYTGPRDFTNNSQIITAGPAKFSGGQVLTNARRIYAPRNISVNATSVYAARNPTAVTIEFDEPASEISMQVMNRRTDAVIEFTADFTDGSTAVYRISVSAYFRSGSVRHVTLPFSDVRKITVKAPWHRFAFFRRWNFAIDGVGFTTGSGEYAVSFSAFVPHNSVPGGPTAFCVSSAENWLPPGLARTGRLPANNARWARDGGFTPAKRRLRGLGGGGETNSGPTDNRRTLYFAGDDRAFEALAPTFRLRQLVTAIPDATLDPDGIEDGSVQNLAGEMRAYAADAMVDGTIDSADDDGIANDCKLFHQAHLAETDLMDVTVTRTGPKILQIRFSGTLDSPMVGPAQVLGAIDWDFTLTLDTSTEPGVWALSGAHDGFPAYEIYINGAAVYQYDPGAPPYEFAKDMRKLLPPLDVAVTTVSGDLP